MATNNFFNKPEMALRRAIELEGIHQEEAALTLLHDVLSSRRHRTWAPSYEQIMITYLDLCLKLQKSREAKDGLHQYRNLSQSQAPGSLEKVIRYLMDQANRKCEAAQAQADAAAAAATTITAEAGASTAILEEDAEDDFGASPQAILLSTMSTDPAKSQRDSAIVLPALKFLWETYRAVLDILRSNSKLEHVYHAAAQNALKFCRQYKRRMEFRHLCDMLRLHLGNLRQYGSINEGKGESEGKSNSKVRGWEGWTTESIELHLQTRFAQLETASVLHRYTEGFRTCEDIFNILQISQQRRKANPDVPPPKAKLMASYYEKLTTLFWVSENYLFHAFAWYKYYTLCREYNRSMSEEMKSRQASAVLLAALCIPQLPGAAAGSGGTSTDASHGISSTIEDGIVKQKMARMATLLGFHTRNPTRETLLAEIRAKNILDQVPSYLRQLYLLLEDNADPLIMVEQAAPLLQQLKQEVGGTLAGETGADADDSSLGRYVQPLISVLLLKLLVNLAAAYHTVSIDFLKKLTSGLGMSFEQVEKSIVLFTQTKALSLRIDHRSNCLRFGDVQLESDTMRQQLTVLSKQLESVCLLIAPPDQTARLEHRGKMLFEIRSNLSTEHAAVLERKDLIEKRKEEVERLAQEREREEKRRKEDEDKERKAEEARRIERERKLREQDKQRRIQRELENAEKKRFLAAMGRDTENMAEEEISRIDTDLLQRQHESKILKKKEEAERKTKDAAKKLDYLVRAIRIEELPLIKKTYDEKIKLDRERYEQEVLEKKENARKQWESDVKDKAAMEEHNVFQHLDAFKEQVMQGRRAQHEILCEEADQNAELEAEKAKLRRARKRKDDELKRQQMEEQRRKDEEERVKAEAEQRQKDEQRRVRDAKEEERRAVEDARVQEQGKRDEPARGSGGGGPASGGKYVPPSRRNQGSGGSSGDRRGGGGGGASRFGESPSYPGGGRYEPRRGADDRGGGGAWRGGPGGGGGGSDDRRSGSMAGPGDGDRRGFGDRRGGGTTGNRDEREAPPSSGGNSRWRN